MEKFWFKGINHLNADCKNKSRHTRLDNESYSRRKLRTQSLSEVMTEKPIPGQAFLNFEHSFVAGVTSDTVLLDNDCSRSILNNRDLFIPGTIKKLAVPIQIQGIGSALVEYEGRTRRFGTMLYCPDIPCQILCYYDVQKRYPITWNQDTNAFNVTFPDGFKMSFTATDSSRIYT